MTRPAIDLDALQERPSARTGVMPTLDAEGVRLLVNHLEITDVPADAPPSPPDEWVPGQTRVRQPWREDPFCSRPSRTRPARRPRRAVER